MILRSFSFGLIAAALTSIGLAQNPVPVGKGSYAEFPPPSAGAGAMDMVQRTFPLVEKTDRPIPTNKLWTSLLNGKAAGALWMYPWRVDPKETGLELFLPVQWNANGSDPVCDAPLKVEGVDFRATGLLVKDWGDWTLSFRLPESDDRYLDVTVGEGMPITWVESRGVALSVDPGREATVTESAGRLLIASAGRVYAVFVPPATRFVRDGQAIRLQFAPGRAFAAFVAMKDPGDLSWLARAAFSIPRDSRMDWSYDAARGQVKTTWTVTTEPLLAGAADVVAQGWLAHHWRGAACSMKLDGPEYLTPRGTMKTSVGNRFEWVYDFAGFLPSLPPPAKLGLDHDFDRQRMSAMLARSAKNPRYGDDSYWGGKDLLRFGQYLQMARELKDPAYSVLRESARRSLADWLTYTPGEKAHYFVHYKNWHALIGIKDSYDSARFNDQHFHYGYFTLSAALLAMEDPEFLRDYGEMIRLVAKQYANWDRKDTRFPLLRTLDIWSGHSWAGGLGSPGGNNQESTSEAMQSWIGLYLLGTMLDDADMTAAGAMGYAMESRATLEYWFNLHGDLFPPQYKHPTVGVLWSGGLAYGTYFSGDPAWIYGIQCLPQSPGLDYLVRDRQFARKAYLEALACRKAKEGSDDLGAMGDLGNVMLSQLSLVDPELAVAEFDRLWDAKNSMVRDHNGSGTAYYNAHAYRRLGHRLWDVRLSVPTGAVYYNPRTKTTSYAAYNPRSKPAVVTAAKGETVLGCFLAMPRQLTCVERLQETAGQAMKTRPPLALVASVPADGQERVDLIRPELLLTFNAPIDAKSLAGVRLNGGRTPALTARVLDEPSQVRLEPAGPLEPDRSYSLVVPAGVASAMGDALQADCVIRFTTRPPTCPPNVYAESYAGAGYSAPETLEVDMRNAESPHSGKYAIKLHSAGKDGMIYFFAGTSDNGDGRKPVDLSGYEEVEFWMKSTADGIWAKVGHPVFDHAFNQVRLTGVTGEYQRFSLKVPEPKGDINTLLAIAVPAGATVFLDDIRFIGPGGGEERTARPRAHQAAGAAFRTWLDASGKHRMKARLKGFSESDGVVQLEREDGTVLSVRLDRLSEKDQVYVRRNAR